MKKKLTSLILCAVLVFTTLVATSCGFNWEKDAGATVTLDYKTALAGTITTTKKVIKPDTVNIKDVWHDLEVLAGNSKDQRDEDEKLGRNDVVTVSVTVKDSADKSVSLATGESSKEVNLWKDLTDAQKTDALYKLIRDDLIAKITGDGVKVGEKVTLKDKAMDPVEKSTTTNGTTTKTYSFKVNDSSTKKYTIEYTVSAAKTPGTEVLFADGDILSLFVVVERDGTWVAGEYNWAYNFASTSSTNGPTGAVSGFDPYDADGDKRIPSDLYNAIIGQKLPDEKEKTVAVVLKTGDKVSKFDYVQIKVEAQYGEYEADGTTIKADSWKKITDVSAASKTQDIKFALSGLQSNDYYSWIRDELLTKVNANEAVVNKDTKLTFTDAKPVKIATDGSKAELLLDDSKGTFFTAGKDGAVLRPVKITYSVTNAYGGQTWDKVDLQEEITEEGTTKTVTNSYYYYISGINELGTVDLEALATSTIGNGSKYDNERPDKTETDRDTRALRLSSHVDSEEGAAETKTHYSSYQYGDDISFLVIEKDDKITSILKGDHSHEDEEGHEHTEEEYLKYTFKYFTEFGTTEVKIDTEDKAVKYAIERGLDMDYDRLKLRYATDEMWTKLTAAAKIDAFPQSLLDAYYDEYYENMRYEFNKEKYDDKVGGYEPSSTGTTVITNTEDYIIYTLKVKTWDEVRAAVDKLAMTDLTPRLVVNKLAYELGITVSDKEIKESQQANYEQYAYMQSIYAQLGMSAYVPASVTEYIELVCGGMESVRTGMLYDKVMHTFYDNPTTYGITFDFNGPKK